MYFNRKKEQVEHCLNRFWRQIKETLDHHIGNSSSFHPLSWTSKRKDLGFIAPRISLKGSQRSGNNISDEQVPLSWFLFFGEGIMRLLWEVLKESGEPKELQLLRWTSTWSCIARKSKKTGRCKCFSSPLSFWNLLSSILICGTY